jgi:hypothetical protein
VCGYVQCLLTEQKALHVSGDKYEAVSTDDGYKKYMMLKIRSVARKDFGTYKCVAKNSLGETDGLIKLDGECFMTASNRFAACIRETVNA